MPCSISIVGTEVASQWDIQAVMGQLWHRWWGDELFSEVCAIKLTCLLFGPVILLKITLEHSMNLQKKS